MSALETRIPPPVVMVLLGAIAWAVMRFFPQAAYALPGHAGLALTIMAAGLMMNLAPKLRFGRAGTTVNPMRPQASSALVTTGLYRWSRNPMYLGHAVMLLAWAVWLRNLLAFAAIPAYLAYVGRFQVAPEERALAATFGAAYRDYCRAVRRWL